MDKIKRFQLLTAIVNVILTIVTKQPCGSGEQRTLAYYSVLHIHPIRNSLWNVLPYMSIISVISPVVAMQTCGSVDQRTLACYSALHIHPTHFPLECPSIYKLRWANAIV